LFLKNQLIDKSKKGIEITLWQIHHQKEQKILGYKQEKNPFQSSKVPKLMSSIIYLSQHKKLIISHKSQEITYKRI
jgi:hypothetical protein